MKIKLTNGIILMPFRAIKGGTVVIENGQILGVHEGNVEVPDATEIDAKGQYIAPGFIDIHVHGGGGFDTEVVIGPMVAFLVKALA